MASATPAWFPRAIFLGSTHRFEFNHRLPWILSSARPFLPPPGTGGFSWPFRSMNLREPGSEYPSLGGSTASGVLVALLSALFDREAAALAIAACLAQQEPSWRPDRQALRGRIWPRVAARSYAVGITPTWPPKTDTHGDHPLPGAPGGGGGGGG